MPTRADYAKINIACKELGLDKYQLLADRYGLETSKELTPRQLGDLFGHFRSLGWRVRRAAKKPSSPVYQQPQQRKIVALWIALGRAGVVRDRSNAALQHYVKRMTGIDRLEWCDAEDTNRVCQNLVEWCRRERVPDVY